MGQVRCPHCLAQGKCGNVIYLVQGVIYLAQSSDSKLSTSGEGVESWGLEVVAFKSW